MCLICSFIGTLHFRSFLFEISAFQAFAEVFEKPHVRRYSGDLGHENVLDFIDFTTDFIEKE